MQELVVLLVLDERKKLFHNNVQDEVSRNRNGRGMNDRQKVAISVRLISALPSSLPGTPNKTSKPIFM